jgi:hypothetical protein
MKILNKNEVALCRAGSCCPRVKKVNDDEFLLTDDYNGSVKITKDQLTMLRETIEHFEKNV